MWYDNRAFGPLKFSISQEVKKGTFSALTIETSKNFILTYFQKLMWFHLLASKYILLGRIWGKTLFRCEMSWTAITETVSITSRFKLEVLKKIFPNRNFIRKFLSRGYYTCNKPGTAKHITSLYQTLEKRERFLLKEIQYNIMTVKLEI